MEGFMEGEDDSSDGHKSPAGRVIGNGFGSTSSSPTRPTTRAGSGSVAMAGLLAARSSGDADVTSPVHNAYGMAEMVTDEADDLLSSHMDFIQRQTESGKMSSGSRQSRTNPSSRRSSGKLMETSEMEKPIAFVAIVTFDLRQGPCLVCMDPPIEDVDGLPRYPLSASDVHSLRTDMPFKALPENGLAAAELFQGQTAGSTEPFIGVWGWAKSLVGNGGGGSGGFLGFNVAAAEGTRSKHHHDQCLFMMRVSGENLFGMSHFLRVQDPSSPRGYTQGAAVCLSRLPFFGLILQRLHSFSTDVIERTACANQVVGLASDLRNTRFEELGHSAVYQDLPVSMILQKLKARLLAILRLLLLEGRVLFYSKSAASVSEAVMAVASLLPGTLPLGLGRLDPPGFGLKAYRWRKYGFPLKLFREDAPLEPLMVIAGAAGVLAKDGFFAGTTNSMVQAMPAANLDVLVDVDKWEITSYRTERARAAFDMGEPDRTFVRELVQAAKGHLRGATGDNSSEAVGWEGSPAWTADQFQLHFEAIVNTAAGCMARNARIDEARRRREEDDEESRKAFEEGGRRGSALEVLAGVVSPTLEGMGINKAWQQTATWLNGTNIVPIATALEGHGRRWAELWTETENFGIWQTSHRLADTLADSLTTDRRLRSTRSYPENFTASSTSPNSNGHTRTASATPTAVGAHNKLDDNLARANSIGNASFLKSGGVSPLPIGLLCGAGVAAGAAFDGVTNGSSRGSVKVKKGDGVPESSLEAYTYDSGDVYTGSWSNGKRHGVGVYEERATGNCYEGDWFKDVRHGRGVLTSGARDFLYDGDWLMDKRTGNGNCVIKGRETYSGQWKDGEFHGRGVHCDARGDVYDGEFVHGQREGVGRWVSKAGQEYVGEWKIGKMSGVGQSTEKDGTAYSGEWHDGRYAGEGTLTLPSGAKYEGMFREGEKHGSGSLLTPEGDTLEGEWDRSKANEGAIEWRIRFANGDHYAGTVLEGVPHGTGTYKYSNGDIFTGGWDRGLRHGQGICVFANGERFEGEWVRDNISYEGKGALTLADGTTHDFA